MGKEIEVYNAFFGDCIILKDLNANSNLLVDFGIHYNSDVHSPYIDRLALTDSIANDISLRYSKKKLSLLITHFHDDHVNGLIHTYKNNKTAFRGLFENIYIANIWNNPFAVASTLLENMLLESQLRRSNLPNYTSSLFDLLGFLSSCAIPGSIKLLSRGVRFEEDNYITLWPKMKVDKKPISKIVNSLNLPPEFFEELITLSEIICLYIDIVLILGEEVVFDSDEEMNYLPFYTLEELEGIYDDLYNRFIESINNMTSDDIDNQYRKLHKLNHKYNIVFQNSEYSDENILFTGDVEKCHMRRIAKATDIPLYQEYKYIKIPHHGTENHYFDYSGYNPNFVMITNGKVKVGEDEDRIKSYMISSSYGTLNAIHVCANCNNCQNCTKSCPDQKRPCEKNRRLVYSQLFITI